MDYSNCWTDGPTTIKGAPARESRTGTRLVSPAASGEKKKMTPAEQGLATPNLVHYNITQYLQMTHVAVQLK